MKDLDSLTIEGELTLLNPTVGDGAGARKREVLLQGKTAAGTLHTLLRLLAQHEGAAADQKAELKVYINAGSDGTTPTLFLTVASTGVVTFAQALAGVQPLDTDLTAIAALVSAADKLAYATGAGTWALTDLTAFIRTLLAAASAAAARTTLGCGTAATADLDTDVTLSANSDTKVATQKAVKAFAEALSAGLKWKASVRAATTAAGTLATSFENGDTVDGVALVTGDRLLIKDQAAATENGIYIVAASGAPARATDADAGAELVSACVFVNEGTANADKGFRCTNDTITLGATNIVFVTFLTNLGALLAVNSLSDVASASAARTNLALADANKRFITVTIGDGVNVPTVNTKCRARVPVGCTITKATMLADASGSAVIDVKKVAYASFPGSLASICASAKPTLSTAQKSEDSTLTGWTTAVSAGDVFEFNLDSVTTCKMVTLVLEATTT